MSWLQPTEQDTEYFEQLRDGRHEQLYQYAQLLAMSVRIDAHLLRNIRLQFLPDSPTELEIILWFSDAIRSRNATGADIHPGLARLLCDDLKTNNEQFDKTKTAIKRLTDHWRSTEKLERDMRWAVLENDYAKLEAGYQQILHSIQNTEGAFEKRELARWAKGALADTLDNDNPPDEATQLYQYIVAALGLPGQWLENRPTMPLSPALRAALPAGRPEKIALEVYPGALKFLQTNETTLDAIEVTLPIPTSIRFTFDSQEPRWESVWYGRTLRIPANTQRIHLEALNGQQFSIEVEFAMSESLFANNNPYPEIVIVAMPEDFSIAREIASALAENSINTDIIDDRRELSSDIEDLQVIRLWSKSAAAYWESRSTSHQQIGHLLLTDETPAPQGVGEVIVSDIREGLGTLVEQIAPIFQQATPEDSEIHETISVNHVPDQKVRVFISYSHDSDTHRAFVRSIADQLRNEGIDCLIDQYINGFPPEGWQRWMEQQIEAADYVLLVCTETYLRRFQGKETDGGKGVNFEGVVISQHLYDAYYHNSKLIPIIPAHGDLDHVPVPLKPYSTYRFPDQYDDVYRILIGQAKYVPPVLADVRKLRGWIKIDRLPTVTGDFFGRKEELQLLDDALINDNTRILQLIGSGGSGKTKLLRHWLNQRQNDIGNYIVWSFYSQGISESKQVSATPLLTEAFKQFGLQYEDYATDEDRADALAQQLAQHHCLLVLDGLEPLQHGGKGFDGQLKDRAMKRLLQQLAQQPRCLCIITSRLQVHDLYDRTYVTTHYLDQQDASNGIQILRSLGVKGSDTELKNAVTEYENHPLALNLLGNALTTYLDGDIHKRDTLEELVDDFDTQGRHAFKVMQGYEHWLTDDNGQPTAELQSLYLLGLFDHPIETAVLQVLWDKQIPKLTAGISRKAWLVAIRDLQNKHRLLSQHGERPDLLDCHPLIREYFGRQLQQQQPDAWQQAHEVLYHYYKALPDKEQPDTLAEMQPLFHAVAHGCAAGLHKQAFHEVYWTRIKRENEHYLTTKLGAFSDDLAVVAHFFTQPWRIPAAGLTEPDQAVVLAMAGFDLRALGRLREAVEPMEANADYDVKKERWLQAAQATSNLSELQLTLGQVAAAVDSGERSVGYADQSGDVSWRMGTRTTHADALHQSGQMEAALAGFAAAEQLQRERQPAYPRLYSLQGFQYCDLLLAQGKTKEVLERAEQTLGWGEQGYSLLDRALDQLSLGRAHHAQGDLPQNMGISRDWLDQAVAGLRKAGGQDVLPRGLLARAALWRDLTEWDKAYRDLAEVWEIAEPSGMRLHLTDYHLERARLLLAQNPHPNPSPRGRGAKDGTDVPPLHVGERGLGGEGLQDHIIAAEQLINETAYHRRDAELAELKARFTQ